MKMKDLHIEIANWFNSGRDYKEGIRLLEIASPKKKVIAKLVRWGDKTHSRQKLEYELLKYVDPKLLGAKKKVVKKAKKEKTPVVEFSPDKLDEFLAMDPKKMDYFIQLKPLFIHLKLKTKSNSKASMIKALEEYKALKGGKSPDSETSIIKDQEQEDLEQYPKIVRRIIHEFNELYIKRAKLHKKMGDVPEANTEDNIEQRKIFSDEIHSLSERMDILHNAKMEYLKNDILPDENKLFGKGSEEKKNNDSADGAELMKRKKNLESSLAKDRNMLLYQDKTKKKEENPMPDGPKKEKIVLRVEKKEKELEEINTKLNK